ncbi:hypothetical protein H7I76_34665, partial [Mycolicibacterium vaccae]|nr:hypothetical protein [Mycolicibacterium vaccae]
MSDRRNSFACATPKHPVGNLVKQQSRGSRALMAAVVAGGLAFSASLYPTPDEVPIFGLLDIPAINRALGHPVRMDSLAVQNAVNANEVSIGDLLQVATILAQYPNILPMDALMSMPNTPGLREVLEAAGMTSASADVVSFHSAMFGGVGGGGGGG